MAKAARNRRLTPEERHINRLISATRHKVEQTFGTLKRIFMFDRARYLTTAKVEAQMMLKALAFHINKAYRRVTAPPGGFRLQG